MDQTASHTALILLIVLTVFTGAVVALMLYIAITGLPCSMLCSQ
ncbi:ORF1C [Fowl aviadenovirus A]|nr:ORF1C [Fowl aviadenovirus A]